MCRDTSPSKPSTSSSSTAFRLDVRKGSWRLAVPAASGQPEVDLSASAVRLQFPGEKEVVVPVPEEARPLDVESARCSFSTKRGELLIDWPQAKPTTTCKEDRDDAQTTAGTHPDVGNLEKEANTGPAETVAEAPAAAEANTHEASTDADAASEAAAAAAAAASTETSTASEPEVSASEWKDRGNTAVKSDNLEEAIRCYSKGLEVGGGDVAILFSNRALCLHKLGKNQEAADDAKQCVALRPDFFKGYLRGAMALRALGKPEEALAFLKRCPKHAEAATLAAELKPEAEAAEGARIATLTGSERAKEEGNVLFRKGQFEQAAAKYSAALEACEDQESSIALAIRNNRAACFHQLSDYDAVVKDTSFVLEREPDNIKALSRRMLALEPLERYEKALIDARCLLRHDPRNDLANKVQHRLSKLVRDLQREA